MKILFFTLIIVISPTSEAAWWFSLDPLNEQEISDNPLEFNLGDMPCGVTRTEFRRAPDNYVMESREIYCKTAKDTLVSVRLPCEYPSYSIQQLLIVKGTTRYFPTLMCGPAKKTHE